MPILPPRSPLGPDEGQQCFLFGPLFHPASFKNCLSPPRLYKLPSPFAQDPQKMQSQLINGVRDTPERRSGAKTDSANPRTTWCGHHCHPYILLPKTTQHIPQLPSCNRGPGFEGQLAVSNSSNQLLLSPSTETLNRTGLVEADRAKRNKSHG